MWRRLLLPTSSGGAFSVFSSVLQFQLFCTFRLLYVSWLHSQHSYLSCRFDRWMLAVGLDTHTWVIYIYYQVSKLWRLLKGHWLVSIRTCFTLLAWWDSAEWLMSYPSGSWWPWQHPCHSSSTTSTFCKESYLNPFLSLWPNSDPTVYMAILFLRPLQFPSGIDALVALSRTYQRCDGYAERYRYNQSQGSSWWNTQIVPGMQYIGQMAFFSAATAMFSLL